MSKKRVFPFGYQMREGQILVNPQEARLVREIFEQYRLGKTTPELAASAMLQGVPYREGTAAWNKNMVCRILDDARYTGTEEYPSIVEQALYDAVCARRSGGRKRKQFSPRKSGRKLPVPNADGYSAGLPAGTVKYPGAVRTADGKAAGWRTTSFFDRLRPF